MTAEISEEIKERIFTLISIPGMEIVDIAEAVGLDFDTVMNILADEYYKYDLDRGRRMCCR